MTLVSVILPTYNGAERVRDAIESVLAQTYTDWELIVVDDGSTDGNWEVISAYASPRVRLIRLPENRGVTGATNCAIETARGELIAIIDDDDRWVPDKLARQVAYLEDHPEIALVHAGVIDVYPSGSRLIRMPPRDADSFTAILTRDRFAMSTIVLRRSVFDEVGLFDPSLRSSGDWELWTRIARKHKTAAMPLLLANAHHHDKSITLGDPIGLARDRAVVLRRRWRELRERGLAREALAQHDHYVGGALLVAGHPGVRRRALRSLRIRPTARAAVLLMLTFMPLPMAQVCWRWLQALRRTLRA